jgi:hypothetical protein
VAEGGAGSAHERDAARRNGWRAFRPERTAARFAALVGRAASGTAGPDPALAALTALASGGRLSLASPQDREFLGRALREIWEAAGGVEAAFREVAALVEERRVDWRDPGDRRLVLDHFRAICEGTSAAEPWAGLSTACRRAGFDVRDPGQRWALLTDRHPLPWSTPLDSVAPAVADRLAALRRDEALAGADTIRRVLAEQGGAGRNALAALAGSADFIRWFLSGDPAPLALAAEGAAARMSTRRLNRLLRGLSLRLHLECGAPYILLRARPGGPRRVLEKAFLDWPPLPRQVAREDEAAFRRAALAPGDGSRRSRYEGTVTELAIMTHNRARILETVRAYADNLIAFGHVGRGVRIHVFDDSTDDGRPERRRRIEALAASYGGRGVPVCYFGPEEKGAARARYRSALEGAGSGPADPRVPQGLEATIGEGGKGAQRNWILLELGGRNLAMIDDDVCPWVQAGSGWPTRRIHVDVLSILNRAAAVPGARAICFAYSGAPDWGEGDALRLHADGLRFGVAWRRARLPVFRYGGGGDLAPHPRAWHAAGWYPVTQGGILAILGARRGLASRVPSPATLQTDLHCQDFAMGCVQDALAGRTAAESSWTLAPHGAVEHRRDQAGRSADKIRTAVHEGLGCLFCRLIPLIREAADAAGRGIAGPPGDAMVGLGRAIEDWLLRGSLTPALMRRRSAGGAPLGEDLESVVDLLRGLHRASGRRGWLYYPERRSLRQAIEAIFCRFGWERLLAAEAAPALTDREWGPALDALQPELLGYARALQLWPALTAVADGCRGRAGLAGGG